MGSWERKPRVSKRQLSGAVDKAFMEQKLLLTALGMIAAWSGRWKAAAKRYREHSQTCVAGLEAENETLMQRVSDLEAELSQARYDPEAG